MQQPPAVRTRTRNVLDGHIDVHNKLRDARVEYEGQLVRLYVKTNKRTMIINEEDGRGREVIDEERPGEVVQTRNLYRELKEDQSTITLEKVEGKQTQREETVKDGWLESDIYLIINWRAPRLHLDTFFDDDEFVLPIEATAKLVDDIPEKSVVRIVGNLPDNGSDIKTEYDFYQVAKNEIQKNGSYLTRKLSLVPARNINIELPEEFING